MARKLVSLCAVCLVAGTLYSVARAQGPDVPPLPPTYTMTDLGTLGGDWSQAVAMNVGGWVAGTSVRIPNEPGSHSRHAFLWTPQDGMVDLGDLGGELYRPLGGTISEATAVNDSGQVVGGSYNENLAYHAFRWTPPGGMVDLGSLGGSESKALAVNINGQVVGWSKTAGDLAQHAFFWDQGHMFDVGTLGGTYSQATAINDSGHVVGISTTADGAQHAFWWTAKDGILDLGTLGGTLISVVAVNFNGQAIGTSAIAGDRAQHAFSWTPGGGMIDLGTLGGAFSSAIAVNNNGQVVGESTTASGAYHAFSWTPAGGMVDLGPSANLLPAGVNDSGQIVGTGCPPNNPNIHAMSWTQAAGMVDLSTFGGTRSWAVAVNASGQVAGHSQTAGDQTLHAILWTPSIPPPTLSASPLIYTGTDPVRVTISGAGLPGATVTLFDGTIQLPSGIPVRPDGTWSASITPGIGTHVFTARQSIDGRTSNTSAPVTVHHRPPVPFIFGPNSVVAVHSPTSVTILGGGWYFPGNQMIPPSGATVSVFEGQTLLGTADVALNGPGGSPQWSMSVDLAYGGHYLTASQVFRGETSDLSPPFRIVVKDTKPVVYFAPPPAVAAPVIDEGVNLATLAVGSGGGAAFNDPAETSETYTATVNYGDGTAGPVAITLPGPQGTTGGIAFNHVYTPGIYMLIVAITDSTGAVGTGQMTVTVRDITPPALALPANITTDSTSPAGAPVSYTATAIDRVDGPRPVSCAPAPGSLFPVGTTTVACSASDLSGNRASGSFSVTVLSAAQMTTNLVAASAAVNFVEGQSLLTNTLATITTGNTVAACNQLSAFINQVEAQAGKKLELPIAAQLITKANATGAALGCR